MSSALLSFLTYVFIFDPFNEAFIQLIFGPVKGLLILARRDNPYIPSSYSFFLFALGAYCSDRYGVYVQ